MRDAERLRCSRLGNVVVDGFMFPVLWPYLSYQHLLIVVKFCVYRGGNFGFRRE